MTGTNRDRDPLPEEFRSEDEASEFWDTHSIADYEDQLEAADVSVELQERRFEIEIDEQTFLALAERSKQTRKSVKEIASHVLRDALVSH